MQCRASLRDEKWSNPIHMWLTLPEGQPSLSNFQIKRPAEMDEVRKGIETYISLWENGFEKGGEQFWHPKINYWKAIRKALDSPFKSIDLSASNFWPSTEQDIHNSGPTKSSHEIMDAYLKENVLAIDDCYVRPAFNKPRDEFIPRVDVAKGQMVIVQSPDPDCAIWLGRAIGDTYQDSDASTFESYKVEVQWWKPTGTSNVLKVLYRNYLNKNQQWVVGTEKNMIIDVNNIIWAWSPRVADGHKKE